MRVALTKGQILYYRKKLAEPKPLKLTQRQADKIMKWLESEGVTTQTIQNTTQEATK